MSKYYNSQRSNKYIPGSLVPFRISRSKIDIFLNCPLCFYMDRRLGIGQPPGFPFSLNLAVDYLLKKEFDIHRAEKTPHALMEAYGVEAIPFQHEKIDEWRDALRAGIQYLHRPTNLLITGGIDDLWINPAGELMVVDYKATAKEGEVSIDADWQITYKRQMEIYQWLFRRNEFNVSPTGYFVYCNGDTNKKALDKKLEFDVKIIPYKGDDSWVEGTIFNIYHCLKSETLPVSGDDCDFCKYREAAIRAGVFLDKQKNRPVA